MASFSTYITGVFVLNSSNFIKLSFTKCSHGALYKVLGELEAKGGKFTRARELFALGLSKDPHCAAVYHAAALLEAKLGNLEVSYPQTNFINRICHFPPLASRHNISINGLQGIAELHTQAKIHFKSNVFESSISGHDDIIERISQLEIVAHENAREGKLSHLDDKFYNTDKFIFDLVQ